MGIDKAALLLWLANHADHPLPLLGGVYTGLSDRINRGDFDEKESD
jgi:hypothetical protein